MQRLGLPPGLFTLADHERCARELLPPATWAYFDGGAADELTLRANRDAWDALKLRPRVLQPLGGLNARTTLLGRSCTMPLLVAPMAHQRLAHPDGEAASALAAGALGAGFVLSAQTGMPLEQVARCFLDDNATDAGSGPLWLQLHRCDDRIWLRELLERAVAGGYQALVLTVDAPVNGVRDRERRAGFALPEGFRTPHAPPPAGGFDALLQQAPTWADVEWLMAQSPLPLLLKGVTHPLDARQAASLGVAGLVVSNHGGRVLDTLPATAELLPAIAEAVQGRCTLLVDGGIRRGTDILKAIALGAQGVLVGRPVLHGLANAGATGVAHVLRLLSDELLAAMALCGVSRLQDAGAALLQPPREEGR